MIVLDFVVAVLIGLIDLNPALDWILTPLTWLLTFVAR